MGRARRGWGKKRTQHGLSNYMFCLDRWCVCHPSISICEGGSWSRWWRKELSWSLTLFLLREGRRRQHILWTVASLSWMKDEIVLWILSSWVRTASVRNTSLDTEDMRETRCKSILRPFSSSFFILLLPVCWAAKHPQAGLPTRYLRSSPFCHDKMEDQKQTCPAGINGLFKTD